MLKRQRWLFYVGSKVKKGYLCPDKNMGGIMSDGMRHSRRPSFPWPFTPTGRHAEAYQQQIKEIEP